MSEATTTAPAAPAASTIKKAKAPKKLASHPPATTMVIEAVSKLNEKKGSSLPAIKKFIAGFYNVDVEKMGTFIRKAIRKQVEAGKLTQVKASFKLAKSAKKAEKKPKKAKTTKPKKPKTTVPKVKKAKTTVKKATSPKKATKPKKSKSVKPKTMKPKAPKVAKAKPAPKKQ